MATIRLRTCQTMTRNSSAMSGISLVSSQPISPTAACLTSGMPVTTVTTAQVIHVARNDHGRPRP